jgi:dephospho-CoA kinase
MRVGLTGGIGSGKSAVARFFSDWGALIIDADQLAREVVAPGTEGLAEIAAIWPQVIIEGSLDRAALSRIVFDDATARERLNEIIHPRVRALAAQRDDAPAGTIVVHMIPLLFEGEYWKMCDRTVLVTAPVEIRIARVMARDGVTREEVEARMRAQIDPDVARTLATDIIRNNGDLETLEQRTRAVFATLRAATLS